MLGSGNKDEVKLVEKPRLILLVNNQETHLLGVDLRWPDTETFL